MELHKLDFTLPYSARYFSTTITITRRRVLIVVWIWARSRCNDLIMSERKISDVVDAKLKVDFQNSKHFVVGLTYPVVVSLSQVVDLGTQFVKLDF